MNDCLFCKIVSGDIPCREVASSENLLAFEDLTAQAPVHVLIIPKIHIESVMDLTVETAPLIGEIHLMAKQIAKEKGVAEDGFRIINNCGKAAGQAVFHIHFHLLGGRDLHWPPG